MSNQEEMEILEGTTEILDQCRDRCHNLISILQEVQEKFGYLPATAMIEIAGRLGISPANVFGVATFYNQFRFNPPGKCHVRVCMGTACHIKQGDLILDQWKRRLEIEEGERTPDGEYSIERVACVGACAMAPVSIVGDEVIGSMAPTKVDGILLQHRIKKEQEGRGAGDQGDADNGPDKDQDGGGGQ